MRRKYLRANAECGADASADVRANPIADGRTKSIADSCAESGADGRAPTATSAQTMPMLLIEGHGVLQHDTLES